MVPIDSGPIGNVFAPVLEAQTYKNALYVLLAFPLALVYWPILFFGFTFGFLLLIVGIGVLILLGVVVGGRVAARFERWLANALLALEIRPPDDRPTAEGFWSTIKSYVDAPSTWRSLGFLLLKFWLGIVAVLVLFVLVTVLELLTAPLRYPLEIEFGTVNDQPIVWAIETLPETALALSLGLFLGIVLVHVTNGLAYVSGQVARALLGNPQRSCRTQRNRGM